MDVFIITDVPGKKTTAVSLLLVQDKGLRLPAIGTDRKREEIEKWKANGKGLATAASLW